MSPLAFYTLVATAVFLAVGAAFGFIDRATGGSWLTGFCTWSIGVAVAAAPVALAVLILQVGHRLTGVPA